MSPERLGEVLRPIVGRVAVVFGPEDNGLDRDQLHRCDLLVHIPARREFPTLNLSHAVAIVLYAIHRAQGTDNPESTPGARGPELRGNEKELFLERIRELAAPIRVPEAQAAGARPHVPAHLRSRDANGIRVSDAAGVREER